MKSKKITQIKITVITLLFIITIFLPTFQGLKNDEITHQIITETFSFPDPKIKINTHSDNISEIQIKGLPQTTDFKKPILPIKPINILLPYGQTFDKIEIHPSHKTEYGTGHTIKSAGAVIPISTNTLQNNKSYMSLNEKYNSKSYQTELYEIIGPYTLRGYSILTLNLYPVQYEAKTGCLTFFKEMDVTLSLKPTNPTGIIRENTIDEDIINKYVVNPNILHSYESRQKAFGQTNNVDYVIITNEELKNAQAEYTFYDFINYKKTKGINARMITVEEITNNHDYSVNGKWGDNNPNNPFFQQSIENHLGLFDDTQARIRNFIRYAYSEWNTNYILLAGDADTNNPEENIIPLRGLRADEKGLPLPESLDYEIDDLPSDVYYACLDGNYNYDQDFHFGDAPKFNSKNDNIDEADLYAEVFVGRACVDSAEEVSNFVYKTISYDAIQQSDNYFSKILFLGERLGSQFYFPYGGGYKDLIEPYVPEKYNLTKLYQRDGPWDYEFYNHLLNEEPPIIINHDGHGSPNSAMGLTCQSIEKLTNEKYYFIYSHTCLAGSFDNCWPPDTYFMTDCVAEYFTVETKHGAIGAVMNSRYGLGSQYTSESPSGAYDESFFKALFNESIRQLGPANHFSKEDNIWRINENGMRWAYYETNLFGDPEISIKKPTEPENVEIEMNMTKPINQSLYINDNLVTTFSFIHYPVIIGDFTITANVKSNPIDHVRKVVFKINNETVFEDKTEPYSYEWKEKSIGKKNLSLIAYSTQNTSVSAEKTIIKLF